MKFAVYISLAVGLVAFLHFGGALNELNFTHPFWRDTVTIYGTLGGVVLAMVLAGVVQGVPAVHKLLLSISVLVFIGSVATTLIAAKIFISAEDFVEWAENLWHKAAYASFGSFVPAFTMVLHRVFNKSR